MERLFEVAQVAAMTQEEQQEYIQTMKTERDIRNYISYAHKKGKEEGRAEGVAEGRAEGRAEESALIAKNLREKGVPVEIISSSTGLTEEQVMAL